MGIGGISVGSLLLILLIVLLLFGTKKLRNIGTDLGGAIKGFRGAMKEGEEGKSAEDEEGQEDPAQLQKSESEAPKQKTGEEQKSREHSS